jgi:hypothetical protein
MRTSLHALAIFTFVACALPWTALMPVSAAVAQTVVDDEALIREGVQLRREGRDRDALERFTRALAVRRSPRALGQAGLAAHSLGLWVDTERYLLSALEGSDDPWIAQNRATLDAMLAEAVSRLGTFELVGGAAGAEVRLSGQLLGTLPLAPVRLVAGSFILEVRAPGFYPVSRPVTIPPQRMVRESLEMAAIPVVPQEPIVTIAPPPQAAQAVVTTLAPQTPVAVAAPVASAAPSPGGAQPPAVARPDATDTASAPHRDGPDADIGLYFVSGPTSRTWLVGADLRVAIPVVDLGTEHLALALGFEVGALYGSEWTPATNRRTGQLPYFRPPDNELDLRVGFTPGIRGRWGLFSLGVRAGYELWMSQDGRSEAYFHLSHAFVSGFEVGLGVPSFTAHLSFDIQVTGDGWFMPLLGAGLSL